jgi:hypothetical protein
LSQHPRELHLGRAALAAGLDQGEITATLRSALNGGHERSGAGKAPIPLEQGADVWATTWPRTLGVKLVRVILPDGTTKIEKKPTSTESWQRPWTEPNRPTPPGDTVGVIVPPGVVVLDIDDPVRFAASGFDVSAYQLWPSISGINGKGHMWFRLDPSRPYPKRDTKELRERYGFDRIPGGTGWVALGDPAFLDLLPSPDQLPLAPDWLQPDASPLGIVTADCLPFGPPPRFIANGWLHPEEGTGLYGKGGTGKGITASYLISLLVREGQTVLVVDYENHPREWGRRLESLGLGNLRTKIHYASPYGRDWTVRKGSIDQVADPLREECDRLGVTYVVVDSYTAASDTSSEALGGQEAASKFAKAMANIGRPYLLLAHVNGAASRHPDKPFGSVFVHNLCFRYSWSVEEKEAPIKGDPDDPAKPAIVSLEFRNQKHNDQPRADDRFLSFSFYRNGDMNVTEEVAQKRQVIDMVVAVLLATPRLTNVQVRTAIKETFGQACTEDAVRKAIDRDGGARVRADQSKVPYRFEAI